MQPDEKVVIETVGPKVETVREQDKIMLVLSYLSFLALIPLLTVKDSEFVRWHAKNGFLLGFVLPIALSIVGGVLTSIIGLLWCLVALAQLAILVVDIMAMVKALNGERWRIPVVSDLADKI